MSRKCENVDLTHLLQPGSAQVVDNGSDGAHVAQNLPTRTFMTVVENGYSLGR